MLLAAPADNVRFEPVREKSRKREDNLSLLIIKLSESRKQAAFFLTYRHFYPSLFSIFFISVTTDCNMSL